MTLSPEVFLHLPALPKGYIFVMENGAGQNGFDDEEEPPMPRVYDLAVFDKSADRIIGVNLADSVCQLPSVQIPVDLYWEDDEVVEEAIEALLGVNVYFSHSMCDEFNGTHEGQPADCLRWVVYVDTCGEEPEIEEPLEWVSREEACTRKWTRRNWMEEGDDMRKEIERVFGELNREWMAEDDRAWMTAGWRGRVTSWAREVLREKHLTMTEKFRNHVVRESSITMKCMISQVGDARFEQMENGMMKGDDKRRKLSDAEDARFDAGRKSDFLFVKGYQREAREGERTAAVGRVVGKIVPEVLGVNKSEGAMLQRDAGALTDDPFNEDVLLETIFTMQKLSMDRLEELQAGGVMVADSRWVEANVDRILSHELLDVWSDVSLRQENKDAKRQIEKLRSCAPTFKKMCEKIAGYNLPNVIVHGDLELHNVGSRSKRGGLYQFFDWENCFIGNPLHDFATILAHVQYGEIPGYVLNRTAGRKEVCKRWLPSVSETEMKKLFEIVGMIEDLIEIHRLSQQYSAYDSSTMEARMFVIDRADPYLDTNRFPNDKFELE